MSSDSLPDEPATVVAHLHDRLLAQEGATTAVGQLVRAAHQSIPGAAGAGISLVDRHGRGVSTTATDAAVEAADALQYELQIGPCLSASATGVPQRIEDTTTETRWAGWSAAAAGSGIRSVLSTPLMHRGQVLGALKVYARAPAAFGESEERLLGLLGEAVATLLWTAQPLEAPVLLKASVKEARETVELATGVLMARDHQDPAAARTALLELARTQERPLIEVAAQLLETAVGHEQARRLGGTMVAADIDRAGLGLYHYSIGGDVGEMEVDAYLHHSLALPRLQRDLLALAANEILEEATPPRAPYAAEILTDLAAIHGNGDGEETSPPETR